MDKRVRSPNYPAMSLPDAIQRINALYKVQHTHGAPREVVAIGIGYSGLNGASASAISALHKYGLLERHGDELKLSERAMSIIAPHSPAERAEAIRAAAAEPTLFAELASRFPGSLPSDEVLRNYLIRNKFSPGAVSGALLAYRDTMDLVQREAGGYDSASVPVPQAAPMDPRVSHSPQPSSPTFGIINQPIQGDTRELVSWQFETGGILRIVTLGNVDTEEALDMAEQLIQIRRKQLKAHTAKAAKSGAGPENNPADEGA